MDVGFDLGSDLTYRIISTITWACVCVVRYLHLDGQPCVLNVIIKDPKLSPIVIVTATRGTRSPVTLEHYM